MTEWLVWLSWPLLLAGAFFFIAGTVGMLRFPDVYTRLHAVTKADTLGLGLVVAGLSVRADSVQAVAVMLLIWLLVMGSGATACQLLGRYQREHEAQQEGRDRD
ncbi:cation:proton antiporter [Marinimicrobium alkaliphilum]|uniref:cation:proton antiporter n=1 Tax=Marinimicrobium alkaliphilum TaxID=2202654 RepID=UPI000DBAAF93|nr:monovalent cation/H(+) antiporter subunit G [Marinimicrobium alkaliphilum]